MRKILLVLAAIVSLNLMATDGALNGKFTINADGDQIVFSDGNLMISGGLQFSFRQWSTLAVQDYNYRDLFGWGTGDTINNVSIINSNYADFTDWGINPIFNGGYKANLWRTLTKNEMVYLLCTRTNAATLFAFGSVNGVNGLILLPDNWDRPAGVTFTASTAQGLVANGTDYINENGDNYSHNTYTEEQWKIMEAAGAVFLPATGYRDGAEVSGAGSYGYYWTATSSSTAGYAYNMDFGPKGLSSYNISERHCGLAVRLVQDVNAHEGFENAQSDNVRTTKIIRNGQLLIEKNGKMYNALGIETK